MLNDMYEEIRAEIAVTTEEFPYKSEWLVEVRLNALAIHYKAYSTLFDKLVITAKDDIAREEREARIKRSEEERKDRLRNKELEDARRAEVLRMSIEEASFEREKEEERLKQLYILGQELASNTSPTIENYNPIHHEEADTRLYYLSIDYKGHTYYKVGITTGTVANRYRGHSNYTTLYDQPLVNARTIEAQVKKDFIEDNFPLTLLGTQGTEVYNRDILGLSTT